MTILRAAILASIGVVGCGADAVPPATPSARLATTPTPTNRLPQQAPTSPTASAVRLSPELAKVCGISEPDAYFAFDSANVRPEDARALDLVAKCFSSGPLKGKALKLVGHADPRGTSEYNMSLGQSRADGIAVYVVGKGIEKSKTQATTRGEMDAAGNDEPSWARDRRVDLLIGQ